MTTAPLLSAIADLQGMTVKLVEGAIDPQDETRRIYLTYALVEIEKQVSAISGLVEHDGARDGR